MIKDYSPIDFLNNTPRQIITSRAKRTRTYAPAPHDDEYDLPPHCRINPYKNRLLFSSFIARQVGVLKKMYCKANFNNEEFSQLIVKT